MTDRVEEWESAYEDSQLAVKRDPTEPQGYCVVLKRMEEEYLFLPRGCLQDISQLSRDTGREVLWNFISLSQRDIFLGRQDGLTTDSVLAAIAMTYVKEKRDGRL